MAPHREAHDRPQVIQLQRLSQQATNGLDVVADRGDRKARAIERRWRIARRGRLAVAEQLGGDQVVFRRIQRLVRPNQPAVPAAVGHVVRGQQDGVVPGRVEGAPGGVHHHRLRQHDAALQPEVVDHESPAFAVRHLVNPSFQARPAERCPDIARLDKPPRVETGKPIALDLSRGPSYQYDVKFGDLTLHRTRIVLIRRLIAGGL